MTTFHSDCICHWDVRNLIQTWYSDLRVALEEVAELVHPLGSGRELRCSVNTIVNNSLIFLVCNMSDRNISFMVVWHIWTTVGWNALKFRTEIHNTLRRTYNNFGDPLTFPLAPSCQNFNLFNTLVYDQILAKLMKLSRTSYQFVTIIPIPWCDCRG